MVYDIFEAATSSMVGYGTTTFFWIDRWLLDGRIKDFVPHLFARIPKRISTSRFVKDGLVGGWLGNVPSHLDGQAIVELLVTADYMEGLTVTDKVVDVFR
jgi:hypothetical protein